MSNWAQIRWTSFLSGLVKAEINNSSAKKQSPVFQGTLPWVFQFKTTTAHKLCAWLKLQTISVPAWFSDLESIWRLFTSEFQDSVHFDFPFLAMTHQKYDKQKNAFYPFLGCTLLKVMLDYFSKDKVILVHPDLLKKYTISIS